MFKRAARYVCTVCECKGWLSSEHKGTPRVPAACQPPTWLAKRLPLQPACLTTTYRPLAAVHSVPKHASLQLTGPQGRGPAPALVRSHSGP